MLLLAVTNAIPTIATTHFQPPKTTQTTQANQTTQTTIFTHTHTHTLVGSDSKCIRQTKESPFLLLICIMWLRTCQNQFKENGKSENFKLKRKEIDQKIMRPAEKLLSIYTV